MAAGNGCENVLMDCAAPSISGIVRHPFPPLSHSPIIYIMSTYLQKGLPRRLDIVQFPLERPFANRVLFDSHS